MSVLILATSLSSSFEGLIDSAVSLPGELPSAAAAEGNADDVILQFLDSYMVVSILLLRE